MKRVPLMEALDVADRHAVRAYTDLKQFDLNLAAHALEDVIAQLAHLRNGIKAGHFDGD